MHILWVKTELLHPVDKGGRIRTYHMLRELRREHQVTYACLDDGSAAPDAVRQAAEYCDELRRVPFRTAPKGSARFYAELALNAASRLPYAVWKYRSRALRRLIAERVAAGGIDVVVCDFLSPSINVRTGRVPAVLFQHNVEAMIWERQAAVATSSLRAAYLRSQWRRMRAHEAAECRRFDHVVAVSPEDAHELRRAYGVRSVSSVPTGVDTAYFRPMPDAARRPNSLVFTGSMDWMPNQDAVGYFVDQILPRIRRVIPDVTLNIVGRHPPPSIRALANASRGISVTGSVPDVRPYIASAAAFVVPIRVGGGTRLKIFEAMAMGCPVISTSVGAEGLPVRHGEHLILGYSADAFACAVIHVLQHPERARALAGHAAELVRGAYSWQSVARQFAAICADTVRRRAGGGASAGPASGGGIAPRAAVMPPARVGAGAVTAAPSFTRAFEP